MLVRLASRRSRDAFLSLLSCTVFWFQIHGVSFNTRALFPRGTRFSGRQFLKFSGRSSFHFKSRHLPSTSTLLTFSKRETSTLKFQVDHYFSRVFSRFKNIISLRMSQLTNPVDSHFIVLNLQGLHKYRVNAANHLKITTKQLPTSYCKGHGCFQK